MNKSQVKSVPDGMRSVTPHLVCAGAADAIAFYKKAFDAVEVSRLPGPGSKLMHAQIRIGDSAIMLVDEFPDWNSFGPKTLKGTSVSIHLYVDNADAVFERAVAAGATAKLAPHDAFWGDRFSVLEDPFGHKWSIATHIRDLSNEEVQQAFKKMSAG